MTLSRPSPLRTFSPAAALVIAHLSKGDADRPGHGARPFGSIFNWNLARAAWEWRRTDGAADELVAGMFHVKYNKTPKHPSIGLRFGFEPDSEHPERVTVARHDLAHEPELLARATLGEQVRAILRSGAKSAPALAEALDKKPDVVRKTLSRMRGVVKLPDGTWGLQA